MIISRRFFIASVKLCTCSAAVLLVRRSVNAVLRPPTSLQIGSLWSGNIDTLEKAPSVASDGFLSRYGIIVSLV